MVLHAAVFNPRRHIEHIVGKAGRWERKEDQGNEDYPVLSRSSCRGEHADTRSLWRRWRGRAWPALRRALRHDGVHGCERGVTGLHCLISSRLRLLRLSNLPTRVARLLHSRLARHREQTPRRLSLQVILKSRTISAAAQRGLLRRAGRREARERTALPNQSELACELP